MVVRVFRSARVGLPALLVLLAGFCVDFAVDGRQDMYCFAPSAPNWAFRCGQIAILAMIASGLASVVGLFRDRRKVFAVMTLACLFPLLVIDALRMGCW